LISRSIVSAYPTRLKGDWECIRHPGGALAVPVTQRQTRPVAVSLCCSGADFGIPAGTVEPNEDPAETIKRELGRNRLPHVVEKLGEFFLAPGYSDEIIYAFLAQDLERLDMPPTQDADEDMETILLCSGVEQAIGRLSRCQIDF